MNKAKSPPSAGARIFPKRWRTKSKNATSTSSPDPSAMWSPGPSGSCTWSSVSGRKVTLRQVSILQLTDPERLALQRIAQTRLQEMELGCPISIPKDPSDNRRSKKSSRSSKRRSKSVNGQSLDSIGKDGSADGLVFRIPISKCVQNDREMEDKRRTESTLECTNSPSTSSRQYAEGGENNSEISQSNKTMTVRHTRKSSSSSQGSLDNSGGLTSYRGETLAVPAQKRAVSSDSLSESESSRNTSSSLIDALVLNSQSPHPAFRPSTSLGMDARELANQGHAQVPYVVKTCFNHIETYGLQTLGIFRVGSSKKRVKHLREEFDSGQQVQLTQEHNPHDVGALLKEYFRDLPEPLLTRDLYMPFLSAKRLTDEHQRHTALRHLVSLLPVANRDTLWALLRFLAKVAQHAEDTTNDKGETIPGNKMVAHNLATLFGPNILSRSTVSPGQASDKELMYQTSGNTVEESKEVIEVVNDMLDNHHDLFELSGSIRDDVLRLLSETDQETTDKVLKHLANQNQIDADPESMCSVFEDSSANSSLLTSHTTLPGASGASLRSGAMATTSKYRPLRVTRSADNCLDSPVSKSRATHMSDSHAVFASVRDGRHLGGVTHSQSVGSYHGSGSSHYAPHHHNPHHLAYNGSQMNPPLSLTPPFCEENSSHHHHKQHHDSHHFPLQQPFHQHQHHQHYPNPLPQVRVQTPDSKLTSPNSTAAALAGATGAIVVLRGKPNTLQVGCGNSGHVLSRPHSEGFQPNLNIPRPTYMRENSGASSFSSSGSADILSLSLNSQNGSENNAPTKNASIGSSNVNRLSGNWGLPTPPTSRGASPSPKAAFFSSTSSTSTLISPSSPLISNLDESHSESPPVLGSAEWERERWKYWERVAAQKSRKSSEAEQETLV